MHPAADLPAVPRIAPPVPAPYLAGAPSLPDDLLAASDGRRRKMTPQQRRAFTRVLTQLKQRLFLARHTFEREHGVKIESERPQRP